MALGKRAIGLAARIPVLSHSSDCRKHLSQDENSPPYGNNLGGSISIPTGISLAWSCEA